MSVRTFRRLKSALLIATTGMVAGSLACVEGVVEIVGSVLSPNDLLNPAAGMDGTVGGVGIEALAELIRIL